jgi:hypothetical protein
MIEKNVDRILDVSDNGSTGKKRNHLNGESIATIVDDWDTKPIGDFANQFGVSENTIRSWVTKIRKMIPGACPKKHGKKTREDIIKEAIEILEQRRQNAN